MLRQKVESISTCYFLCVVYIMGKNGGWVDGRALGFNEVIPKCGQVLLRDKKMKEALQNDSRGHGTLGLY